GVVGLFTHLCDDGVERRVDRVDPSEVGLQRLPRGDRLAADGCGKVAGGEFLELRGHASSFRWPEAVVPLTLLTSPTPRHAGVPDTTRVSRRRGVCGVMTVTRPASVA